MSNKTYDRLKLVAQIILPAIGTFFVIASIWGLPHADQVVGTVTALDTLLGTMLSISSMKYNKENNNDEG